MSNKKVAIIGECMIELSGTPFGEMKQSFGGDSLNAAVYLKRMSDEQVEACYVSVLGDDKLSETMRKHWQAEQINTDWVLRDTQRGTGLYMISVDQFGERSFQYWRSQSAAKYLLQHAEFASVAEQLLHVDVIFLSGITLAILSQQDRKALVTLLKQCRSNGVEIAFDSNHRPALWPSVECAQQAYGELFAISDIALVTFDDEQCVWQDEDAHQTLNRLQAQGVSKAIVKLGEKGCLSQVFAQENKPTHTAAYWVDTVLDTTSAGDSFNGAFLAQYVNGQALSACCQAGNLLASHVIQHRGAIIPTVVTDPICELIKEFK
ncbi:sugar kinase [Vibrio scophthalmi]|uniref:sugar kinase n=1 Tax=Vibrio scophthalmi TaxID=45658 RepID=UPI003EBA8B66